MTRKIKREAIRRRTRRRNPRENPSRALQPGLQRPQRGTARSLVEVHRLRRSDAQVRLQAEPIGRGLAAERLRTRGSLPRVCVCPCVRVYVCARAQDQKAGLALPLSLTAACLPRSAGSERCESSGKPARPRAAPGESPKNISRATSSSCSSFARSPSRVQVFLLFLFFSSVRSLSPHLLLAADPAIPRATNMNTQRINRRALSRARTAFVPARVRAPRRGPFAAKKVLKEPYLLPSAPARTGSARTGDGRLEDR